MGSTFQSLKAKYDREGSDNLQAERAAMSQMIRAGRPHVRSQAEMDMERTEQDLDRRQQALDKRLAGLDQGARGGGHDQGGHAPPAKPTMSDMLRRMRNGSE
jgi:hypothetical protein